MQFPATVWLFLAFTSIAAVGALAGLMFVPLISAASFYLFASFAVSIFLIVVILRQGPNARTLTIRALYAMIGFWATIIIVNLTRTFFILARAGFDPSQVGPLRDPVTAPLNIAVAVIFIYLFNTDRVKESLSSDQSIRPLLWTLVGSCFAIIQFALTFLETVL